MTIRYLGHSAFAIQIDGCHIIVDPFIKDNELAVGVIDIDHLKADYIMLTHGHNDHVADAEYLAKKTGAVIISNFEIVEWYQNKGLKGHPMNLGGSWNFEFGKVKYVSAIHSSVLPDGTHGGNPGGFVISHKEGTLYISGDTAVTMDMKLIPMMDLKPDLCIFPIGDNFTMGIQEALLASDFVECNRVIGCHYDTFGFIKIDKASAIHQFKSKGKQLILPAIGKSLEF